MKKTLFLLLVFISTLISPALAQTGDMTDWERKLLDNKKQQEETQKKIAGLKNQEVTLKNQISYMDGQINLTSLRIEAAKVEIEEKTEEITKLEGEIGVLGTRIERMGDLVDIQRESFDAKIRHYYKERKIGFLEVIFGGDTLTSIVRRLRYLVELGKKDQELISQMRLAEANFKGQRTILSEKKEKVEDLRAQVLAVKAQMENQKAELGKQKQAKADLLSLTQNDEVKFQEVLARLKAEEEEMRNALGSLFNQIAQGLVDGTDVSKGAVIGLQGNTGNVSPTPSECTNMGLESTCGSHLHFMVLVNPATCENMYNCHVNPDSYLDDGNYSRPLAFDASWRDYVTQYYGETDFARSGRGGYGFHSGIDFNLTHGAPIHTIDNGKLYNGVDKAGGKFAVVIHGDSFYTAYWHLQ